VSLVALDTIIVLAYLLAYLCCDVIHSMKRLSASDITTSQPDMSCLPSMDKFDLSSPTRTGTTAVVRYRPTPSSLAASASPSHLHHLLRSHGNVAPPPPSAASGADAVTDMRGQRREDGDGRSCDSVASGRLAAVSETSTMSPAESSAAATMTATTGHRHALSPAAESDDDDDDELSDRRRRRLRLTVADDDADTAAAALSTPLLQLRDDVTVARVHSSAKISTQPSFSQVMSSIASVRLLFSPLTL